MRRIILVPALLCGITVIAGAQTKVSARLSCEKPNINETAGAVQMIMFSKANCTWPEAYTVDGSKPKRTVDAGIGDMNGSTARVHGYSTSVFDHDDSTIVRYEGTMAMKKDGSGTDKGTWRYVRGTGKFKGISGSGTFKGAAAADGSGWADVTGHYSLPKAKAKKP
ncbi:MAG TPA: hypothetical protein VIM21_09590 [Gemmatimonadaceae bacterium]